LQNSPHKDFLPFIFLQFIDYFKRTLESDRLFCFAVPFPLAEKKIRFRAKNGVIREQIAPLRANQIARITSDFKMDLINNGN